ncbi:MAG: hypothetical protein JOZ92_01290 [Candidatus Dormibacteraeota bacterium]|nr:hypothetical protein [Candidatus Dormibacteraeota bacterium]
MTDQVATAPAVQTVPDGAQHHHAWRRLQEMQTKKPALTSDEHFGLNGKIAVFITENVGTMWCAYVFAVIGITGIVASLSNNTFLTLVVAAVSGYFLQLVLLPIIIVGQNIQGRASDKRAIETYKDAEAILGECLHLQKHLQEQDQLLDDIVKRMQVIATAQAG